MKKWNVLEGYKKLMIMKLEFEEIHFTDFDYTTTEFTGNVDFYIFDRLTDELKIFKGVNILAIQNNKELMEIEDAERRNDATAEYIIDNWEETICRQ